MEDNSTIKRIRFIDSQYTTLFYVPDGGNVILICSDGEKLTRSCKYLDDYHVQIGSSIYHICEFAEKMERIGTTYVPEEPPVLPDRCFSTQPSSGELILITRGNNGYSKCGFGETHHERNRIKANQLNAREGITRQQEAAMLGGSMFGWNSSAAKTTSYDMHGNPLKPIKARATKNRGMER